MPADDDEDDGGAYEVARLKRCRECGHESPAAAVICVNCGFNFKTGRKLKKVVKVKTVEHSWWFGAVPLMFYRVWVRKTKQGQKLLTLTLCVLFIPLYSTEVELQDGQEILTDYREGFGPVGLTIMLVLLLFCLVPGVYWWRMASSNPNYIIQLPRRKLSPLTLYEGRNDDKMRRLIDQIKDVIQVKVVRK